MTGPLPKPPHRLSLLSASSIVVANMVGTGVFTSLGYQVMSIHSEFALIMLWVTGGVLALCGAMVYAELGSRFPESGGEYHLLSKIYHPLPGFLSGWISTVAGFAAPTALAAIAFGKYIQAVNPALDEKALALGLVAVFVALHSFSVKQGTKFQDVFTLLKVLVILVFIIMVLASPQHEAISLLPDKNGWGELFQPAFAVNLVYVSFAYTGWNAAIYVVGEIRNPLKNLPRSLLAGTVLVTILYAALNFAFLYAVPQSELAGKVEIGHLTATRLFGIETGGMISVIIGILMISTVSVMVFIGPRVILRMAEDFSSLRYFNKKSKSHVPVRAVLFQGVITILFIVTSTFDQVILYAGFSLIVNTMMTVFGIFIARWKFKDQPTSFKAWGYPFTPIFFLAVNSLILIEVFIDKPIESLIGTGIVLVGVPVYYVFKR